MLDVDIDMKRPFQNFGYSMFTKDQCVGHLSYLSKDIHHRELNHCDEFTPNAFYIVSYIGEK